MPHDTRDQIVDFVRRWSEKTEIGVGRFISWLAIRPTHMPRSTVFIIPFASVISSVYSVDVFDRYVRANHQFRAERLLATCGCMQGLARLAHYHQGPRLGSSKFVYLYQWLHVGVGWLLITLGVAGVTGLIRKE